MKRTGNIDQTIIRHSKILLPSDKEPKKSHNKGMNLKTPKICQIYTVIRLKIKNATEIIQNFRQCNRLQQPSTQH